MSVDENTGLGPSPLETGQPQSARTPVIGVSTGALIKLVSMSLAEGDLSEAGRYADQALAQDPANGAAYLGKLMVELGLRTEDELVNGPTPFFRHPLFQQALQFSTPEQQARLMALAQAWNTRAQAASLAMPSAPSAVPGMPSAQPGMQAPNVPTTPNVAPSHDQEDSYASAVALMRDAMAAEEFLQVAQMFDALGMYRDARMMAWKARRSAREITEREQKARERKRFLLVGIISVTLIVVVVGGWWFFAGRKKTAATELLEALVELDRTASKQSAQAQASNIISGLRSLKTAMLMLYADHMDDFERGAPLSSFLGSPSLIMETLEKYVDDPHRYADGSFVFEDIGGKWFIGYKLKGVSRDVKKELAKRAESMGLLRSADTKTTRGGGYYTDGDIVYMVGKW